MSSLTSTYDRTLPQVIYIAAKSNNVDDLKQCLISVQARPGVPNLELEWKDSDGMTPLIVASHLGHVDVLCELMKRGADLRAMTGRMEGGSALHEAVSQGHDKVAIKLLEGGASAFLENHHGQTAHDLAISRGNISMVHRFEKEAAEVAAERIEVYMSSCLGRSDGWKVVRAVVITREPSPMVSLERRILHRQLLLYCGDQLTVAPLERLFIDGARIVHNHAACRVKLMLHPTHSRPSVCVAYKDYSMDQNRPSWSIRLRRCFFDKLESFYLSQIPGAPFDYMLTQFTNTIKRVQPAGGGGCSLGVCPPRSTPSLPASPSHSNAASASSASSPESPPLHYQAAHIHTPASAPTALRTPHHPGIGGGAESDEEHARRLQREELQRAGVTAGSIQNSDLAEVCQAARNGGAQGARPASADFDQADSIMKPLRAAELDSVTSAQSAESHLPDDDVLCQICLEKRKEMAFLHGGECHECACLACATSWFKETRTCPICNQPAEQIIRVYR